MLDNARLVANLRASDLERTIAFYEGKLGLALIGRREVLPGHEEVLFRAGGAVLCIERGTAAPSGQTPVSFEVDDIESAVDSLRKRGVAFEDYDLPSIKTVGGIATVGALRGAWFKDPDGTLLGLVSRG